MKKGGGPKCTIIVGPSKSVLVYALHSLDYILGLARFRVFVPKLLLLLWVIQKGGIEKLSCVAVGNESIKFEKH